MKSRNHESDKILGVIFENTHTMIAYLDEDLNFIRVNKSYAAANSKNPDYYVGKNHFALFPNEENEIIFRNVLKTGEPYFAFARAFEYEYNPEIGVTHWDWSLVPVKNDGGGVKSLILHLVNVTSRIKAEEELQTERDFNKAVLESANALIMVMDKSGRIVRFNPACEKLAGFKFTEVKGKFPWDMFIEPEGKESAASQFLNISGHNSSGDYSSEWVVKDGSKKLIRWSYSVIAGENGSVQSVVAVGVDITEQEKIKNDLIRSEETMKKAQESAHIGTWEWNINEGSLFWSDEVYRIFGVDSHSFKSTFNHFKAFIHPDDLPRVEEQVNKSLQDATHSYYVEHRIIRPDGEVRHLIENGKVYFDRNKPYSMVGIVQDITARKLTESALEKNRNILEVFMETVSDGMTILDKDLNIVEINRAASKIFKKEREELIGKNVLELAPDSRKTERFQRYMQVIETGEPFITEDAQIRPAPDEYYMSVKAFKVGEGLGLVTTDTTRRVKANNALKDEFEFNQLILQTVPTGIAIYEETGQCVAANQAVADKVGGSVEKLLNQNFHEIQSWKDCGLYDAVMRCLQENIKLTVFDFDITTSFGKKISIESQIVPFIRKNRRHVLLTLDDITVRKQAVKALKESEERYELAVNGSNDGIWDWNVVTSYDYFSPRFRELLGFDETDEFPETLDSFTSRLFPDDRDRVARAIEEHLVYHKPYNIEMRLRKKDGSYSWFLSRGQAIWDESGKAIRMAGSVTDIAKNKQDEAEILQYKDHLEDLVQERTLELKNAQDELVRKGRLATLGQLTATVSHELRNPLGAMRPSLYILEKRMPEGDEKISSSIERIKRGIDRCDHIIDELLDFTRSTALEKSDVPLDDWLDNLLDELAVPAGVKVVRKLQLGKTHCSIDADRMRRAVINAFDNGCQAMFRNQELVGPGIITVGNRRAAGNRLEIIITDTGSGIPDVVLPKIFEPLFSTKGFGVGLGMSAIKQILEQHNGGVDVETEQDKGTTVTLWFPEK